VIRLTVLADDEPGHGPLRAAHGLSVWVEAADFRVLFDAGQGPESRDNAALLGVDLQKADAIAISHGHYDHTGGLPYILPYCRRARLFLHPEALTPRYSRSADGGVHAIGYPHRAESLRTDLAEAITWTRTVTLIGPSIYVTGEIPLAEPPEAPPGRFFLDPECRTPDPIVDDQALVVDTEEGAVVILGCSHAGVGNTLSYALGRSRSGKLRAVVGGLHLSDAPQERIVRLSSRLAELSPTLICPCHCSGKRAKDVLKDRLPGIYREGRVGATFVIDRKT
jgi:7,8-dihydropterin-6-yl-methyl-4-(beta-D-ribofuranosyl)aminobenzene 5'-phosphate synthase